MATITETNPYQVLGLGTAGIEATKLTKKDITKAYRLRALKLHPDKNPDDPNAKSKFQLLSSSYQALMDDTTRKRIDDKLVCEHEDCSNLESLSLVVSWKASQGFCDHSADRIREFFEEFGRVDNVCRLITPDTEMMRTALVYMSSNDAAALYDDIMGASRVRVGGGHSHPLYVEFSSITRRGLRSSK